MDHYSKFKHAISHKVHKLKSSAANDISIILPSRKVKARGSCQFQQSFDVLQSSVGNNQVIKNSGYNTSQSTGQSD